MKIITIIFLVALFLCTGIVMAQDEGTKPADDGLILKQAFVYPWKTGELKNMTTIEGIRTKPVDGWPKFVNAAIDGWSLDPGWAYDATSINNADLMLGRKVGTLGKYVPFLDFPLINMFDITIYPIGLHFTEFPQKLKTQGASGGAYFTHKF